MRTIKDHERHFTPNRHKRPVLSYWVQFTLVLTVHGTIALQLYETFGGHASVRLNRLALRLTCVASSLRIETKMLDDDARVGAFPSVRPTGKE
jgi:hypothetical protein